MVSRQLGHRRIQPRNPYHLIHRHGAIRKRHGTKNNTNDIVHGRLIPLLVLGSHSLHLRRHACSGTLAPCLLLLLASACALGREPPPCPAALLLLCTRCLLLCCCRRLPPGVRRRRRWRLSIERELAAPLVLEFLATRKAGP